MSRSNEKSKSKLEGTFLLSKWVCWNIMKSFKIVKLGQLFNDKWYTNGEMLIVIGKIGGYMFYYVISCNSWKGIQITFFKIMRKNDNLKDKTIRCKISWFF